MYGNGQTYGDPYPEHFVTTQVMVADTHTFNSSTVLDVRFGFTRWISERSGIAGMETIPNIEAGQNQFINSSLIYADDETYSLTPTLTKIVGDHTLKAGANILHGEVNYFQNNTPGGTFTFASAPTALDGTNPGPTGDPFASFLIGQPTGARTSHRALLMVGPGTKPTLSRIPGR